MAPNRLSEDIQFGNKGLIDTVHQWPESVYEYISPTNTPHFQNLPPTALIHTFVDLIKQAVDLTMSRAPFNEVLTWEHVPTLGKTSSVRYQPYDRTVTIPAHKPHTESRPLAGRLLINPRSLHFTVSRAEACIHILLCQGMFTTEAVSLIEDKKADTLGMHINVRMNTVVSKTFSFYIKGARGLIFLCSFNDLKTYFLIFDVLFCQCYVYRRNLGCAIVGTLLSCHLSYA